MAADPPARPKRGRSSLSDQLSPEPRDDVKRSTNKTVDIHLGNCHLIALGYINFGVDRIETRIRELLRRREQENNAVTRRRQGQGRRSRRHEQQVGSTLSPNIDWLFKVVQRARRFSEVVITGQLTRSVEGAAFRRTDLYNPVRAVEDFASFESHLPVELVQEIAWTPFAYSLEHLYLPARIHESMSTIFSDNAVCNWEYQELLDTYLRMTAGRLSDISPCYMDIWRTDVPSMALGGADGSAGLLNALITFAAVHVLPLKLDRDKSEERILMYYGAALSASRSGLVYDDARRATMLLLAHIEVRLRIEG